MRNFDVRPAVPAHSSPVPRALRLLAIAALFQFGAAWADDYADVNKLVRAGQLAEALAKADDKVLPIGQLWLLKLTPMSGGEKVSADKLRLATIKTPDGDELKVPQCALGVQRGKGGALELLVFGKDKEPLLKVALKPIDVKQSSPIELDAERGDESAQVHLKILGKYQATFKVTQLEL